MQPGIGNDLFEIYKGFKTSKAESQKQNRLLEIGGLAGSGDYAGAANKAMSFGDFETGNNLLNIATGQKKQAQAFDAEDRQQVAGALYAADTPEKWQATINFLEQSGHDIDDTERDFRNREAIIGQALGPDGLLKQMNADREFGVSQMNAETNRMNAGGGAAKPPSGYRATETGLEPIPGGPADPNKPVPVKSLRPTTDQNNAAGFYDRLVDAEAVLSDPLVTAAATGLAGKTMAGLPVVGNYLATPEYQKFDQAQRNFINAVLRKESGAAIAESEFANAAQQYFPQPGDSKEKIAQKAQNRATVIRAMQRTAAGALTQGGQQQQGMGQAEQGEIPSEAISELLDDPSGAAEFDEVFGPGAAQQILGNQ